MKTPRTSTSALCLLLTLVGAAFTGVAQEPGPPRRPIDREPAEREAAVARPGREARPLAGRPVAEEAYLNRWAARWERALAELREQQAIQIKQAVRHLEERLERFSEKTRPHPRVEGPRPDFGPKDGPAPERGEAKRRLEHLTVAIDHLRAAGLKDAAERLQREREEMVRHLEGDADRAAPVAELRRLRAELEELRQALGRLQAHVEELHRDRR
ncbi:MAG: hypothetical protein HS113_19510 [Verrucomicrobiales bacterium]|nr:hypothetical protein [Verrucomicrobiales bacterium]